jgi:glycosyltransferase involved in cell wall biosynthesis
MSVLIFSELFYPHGSGAELATKLYSDLLAKQGFKITVITRQFPSESSVESQENGITIYRLPMNMMFGTRYDTLANTGKLVSSFIQHLIKQNDVIYVPGGWYSVIPFAKAHKKPVVVHLHNYSIVCSTSLMYDFTQRKVAASSLRSYVFHEIIERRRNSLVVAASSFLNETVGKRYNQLGMLADALIFVSKTQRNLTLSKAPQLSKKSYVIYNPIPNIPLIEAEEKAIGYFGGKRFVKGFPVLMRSLKILKKNNVNAYMTMTSAKPKTMKTSNGVLLNFLPKLSNEHLLSLLKKLSVVVIPSEWPEPLPYTLLESMLYGKLIIASNIGGIPEIVNGLSSGVKLTNPGDYVEISNSLDSFLSLELDDVNEIGLKLRNYVLEKFDNGKSLKSFIKILNTIDSSG